MGSRVWTLTQTEDALWYHVYKNKESPGKGDDKIARAVVSVRRENEAEMKLKGTLKKEEEEEPVAVTSVQDNEEEMLRDYFQLNVKLEDLYKEWGDADPHFRRIADIFSGQYFVYLHMHDYSYCTVITKPIFTLFCFSPGVRMLRQEPTECLFSFICTSNNHISRIQGMVERLCQALGTPLCRLDETSYHNFPSLSVLAGEKLFIFPYIALIRPSF